MNFYGWTTETAVIYLYGFVGGWKLTTDGWWQAPDAAQASPWFRDIASTWSPALRLRRHAYVRSHKGNRQKRQTIFLRSDLPGLTPADIFTLAIYRVHGSAQPVNVLTVMRGDPAALKAELVEAIYHFTNPR